MSTSSLGDLHNRPRSSFSSLSLNAWPIPPALPLDVDTIPFSEFFANDLLDDTGPRTVPARVLSSKRSDISIKTIVLENTVVSQIVDSVKPENYFGDAWLSRRKSILPTITELDLDDQTEKCSIATHQEADQPFEVNLDNCLLTSIIQGGTPQAETTLLYAAQLVASISSLHAAGIVHGLISPETVAIRNDKYLVLCDCERRTRITSPSFLNSPPVRDHEHQRMYLYDAPEIILGWSQGSAVDSWGFGIVLYYMLIGFHPFGDRNGQEDRIVNAKSHTLRYLDLIDKNARDLVFRCLERNPALRPSVPEIKAHPYFSAIDWSKMITRYVRVTSSEELHPYLARPPSMQFSSPETLEKISPQLELGVSDLVLTFEDTKACSESAIESLQSTVDKGPAVSTSTVKSEWFLSTTDVLETMPEPKAKLLEETPLEPASDQAISQKEEIQQEVIFNDQDRRMKLFWDLLDSEPDLQATSVPDDGLTNSLTYFTSRPRRLRKRGASSGALGSQLSLWRSSIEVSSARIDQRSKKDRKAITRSASQAVLESTKVEAEAFNFPPGIERIGNGIGYTYALPAASRSGVSICSTVPRSCHGLFGGSSKFSMGLGLGLDVSKAKLKSALDNAPKNSFSFGTSRTDNSPETSPEWNMSPFCDNNTTAIIYGSSRPTLTNAIPTSNLGSPKQDSEADDSDEAGPLTPDTVALESRHDKGIFVEEIGQDIRQTPTLRLVSEMD